MSLGIKSFATEGFHDKVHDKVQDKVHDKAHDKVHDWYQDLGTKIFSGNRLWQAWMEKSPGTSHYTSTAS